MSQGCKKKTVFFWGLTATPSSFVQTVDPGPFLIWSTPGHVWKQTQLVYLWQSDSLRDHRLSHVSPDNGAPSNSPTFLPFSSITGDVISQEQTVLHLHWLCLSLPRLPNSITLILTLSFVFFLMTFISCLSGADLLLCRFSSTCSVLTWQITTSSPTIVCHGASCPTSSVKPVHQCCKHAVPSFVTEWRYSFPGSLCWCFFFSRPVLKTSLLTHSLTHLLLNLRTSHSRMNICVFVCCGCSVAAGGRRSPEWCVFVQGSGLI